MEEEQEQEQGWSPFIVVPKLMQLHIIFPYSSSSSPSSAREPKRRI